MVQTRNMNMPLMAARLAFVYHLISRSLGRQQQPAKQRTSHGHSFFSAVLIVGSMTVGTIFAISLLQLLFSTVD